MNKSIIKGGFGFLLLSVALYSCKASKEATKQNEATGINVSYMDKSVNPADNFNQYVNGSWLDKTEIPSDRTRWGKF